VFGLANTLRGGRTGFQIQAGTRDFIILRSSPTLSGAYSAYYSAAPELFLGRYVKLTSRLHFVSSFGMSGSISLFKSKCLHVLDRQFTLLLLPR
jgi:hypothetical protein